MTRLTQSVAMGVGVAGAMTDVSSYADLEAGVSRSWGRKSEFDDTAPGTFSFTLDNADGRFTPGNTASALATTVTEGMSVCWKLDDGAGHTRLVAGTVQGIEPAFPSGESAWAQVRITCDDMLGNAARRSIGSLPDALFDVATGIALWPLNDGEGTIFPAQTRGGALLRMGSFGATGVTYGVTTSQIKVEESVCALVPGDSAGIESQRTPRSYYPSTSYGGWGMWVQRASELSVFHATIDYSMILGGSPIIIVATNTSTYLTPGVGSSITTGALSSGTAHYLSYTTAVSGTFPSIAISVEFFVDNISVGTSSYSGGTILPLGGYQQIQVRPRSGSLWVDTCYVSRIAHSLTRIDEPSATTTTAPLRLAAIASTTPEITFDTLPTLSPALLGPLVESSGSALDEINRFVRGEQGYVYTATTGSLTAPTQKVTLRSRDRTTTALYTFGVESESSGSTEFVRDVTNLLSRVTVAGTDVTVTYSDSTLAARAGSSNASEDIPLFDYTDVFTWATDRTVRGANVNLRAASFTVDAFTTPTNRAADLLAFVPGDRIQVTGLPSTQLGFSTWDGWLLGVDETHTLNSHEFTMYLSPALPTPGIYDTNYWMADGALTLSSSIASAGATSMSVATTGPKLETSAVPYDLLVDSERVTVTACTGATPQVATITRGVGGTTATTHTTAAVIEVPTSSLYGF